MLGWGSTCRKLGEVRVRSLNRSLSRNAYRYSASSSSSFFFSAELVGKLSPTRNSCSLLREQRRNVIIIRYREKERGVRARVSLVSRNSPCLPSFLFIRLIVRPFSPLYSSFLAGFLHPFSPLTSASVFAKIQLFCVLLKKKARREAYRRDALLLLCSHSLFTWLFSRSS